MQNAPNTPSPIQSPAGAGFEDDTEIDLMQIFAVAKRRWYILIFGLLAGLVLGVAHAVTSTSIYTSSVHISVGSSDTETTRELSGISGEGLDEKQIVTEIQVLRSEQIAARVVDDLNLTENTAFLTNPENGPRKAMSTAKSALRYLANAAIALFREEIPELHPATAELNAGERQAAIGRLRANMQVSQIGRSRVLQVSYTSVSPQLAAQIANAIANAYIEDQLASKYEATQRATNWLKERSDQLRVQSGLLDKAVETFRQQHNLIGVGGDLSSDTELEVLNQQVANIRAELLKLETRSNRLREIVAENDTSAFVSSTASQSITSNLREKYLETLRDYNRLQSSLGDDHQQTRKRQRELVQIEALMFEEIKRSEILARNDVQEARVRLTSLEEAQAAAEDRLGADNTTLVELRELERNADTVRSLYSSFLQRYQQSLQEQSFPVSDARVLNPARIPQFRSAPKLTRITAIAGILGFILAAAWIAIREVMDNKLRTEEQVRNKLGLEFLGGLTRIPGKRHVPAKEATAAREGAQREVIFPEIMRYGVEKPLSNYSEALRTGKMSAALKTPETNNRGQVIGVVSCFPGEGKTTTSANFASLLVSQGSSVLLIDGDLRNPGLSRALGGEFEVGLVDALLEGSALEEVIYLERNTGTHVIPNRRGRVVHTSELLGSGAMESLLKESSHNYDYVVVDLPPLGPVIDARAMLHNLDGIFFVAKWGSTNINFAENILQADPRLRSKCYGAYLNMFDAKKASAYGSYEGSSYYYGKSYARYYNDW
jgi:succinoglycan biosynthesis transport protein ExoP